MPDRDDKSWLDKKADREKLSWREQDAKRNQSRHVPKEESNSKPKTFEARREKSQAVAALNEFFSGKKSKEGSAHWKKVIGGSPKEFSARASKYVEEFGLPYEWDDLLRLLDHEDPVFLTRVLDQMLERIPNESESRKELLRGKLRIVKMERDEPQVLSKVESAMSVLS